MEEQEQGKVFQVRLWASRDSLDPQGVISDEHWEEAWKKYTEIAKQSIHAAYLDADIEVLEGPFSFVYSASGPMDYEEVKGACGLADVFEAWCDWVVEQHAKWKRAEPTKQQYVEEDVSRCHYCGQPAKGFGFFGEPACEECGGE